MYSSIYANKTYGDNWSLLIYTFTATGGEALGGGSTTFITMIYNQYNHPFERTSCSIAALGGIEASLSRRYFYAAMSSGISSSAVVGPCPNI